MDSWCVHAPRILWFFDKKLDYYKPCVEKKSLITKFYPQALSLESGYQVKM